MSNMRVVDVTYFIRHFSFRDYIYPLYVLWLATFLTVNFYLLSILFELNQAYLVAIGLLFIYW
jgi:hypothetical protein